MLVGTSHVVDGPADPGDAAAHVQAEDDRHRWCPRDALASSNEHDEAPMHVVFIQEGGAWCRRERVHGNIHFSFCLTQKREVMMGKPFCEGNEGCLVYYAVGTNGNLRRRRPLDGSTSPRRISFHEDHRCF